MFLLKNQGLNPLEGLLFSLIAIVIVFIILVIIIFVVSLMSKIKFKEEAKPVQKAVAPAQKKLTIEDIKDEDMMVAALIATAEFVEETKEKDARLASIKQIG